VKAREHLQTELLLFPTPEALFQVGFVQLQLGELDKCVECLERVRKYKNTDTHNYLQATVRNLLTSKHSKVELCPQGVAS